MPNYDCVGVIGGGSWGTTLAHILGKNGYKTLLWLRDPDIIQEIKENQRNSGYTHDFALSDKIIPTDDLKEVADRCELMIVAIPSGSFRKVLYQLGNHVKGDQILVSACKGMEVETCCSMTEIFKVETCVKKIGVLSGPNLFQEILKGNPCAAVIASKFHEVLHKVVEKFNCRGFRVYTNEDVIGVELGGVIKNVIAIAAGMADGLGFGNNTKALLMTRGIAEMRRIGVKIGANSLTFAGLSGLGDMLVTSSSKLSRNYRVGYYLAQGQNLAKILQDMNSVAEGINTSKVLHEFCLFSKVRVPIIEGVYQILYENKSMRQVVCELMAQPAHLEISS